MRHARRAVGTASRHRRRRGLPRPPRAAERRGAGGTARTSSSRSPRAFLGRPDRRDRRCRAGRRPARQGRLQPPLPPRHPPRDHRGALRRPRRHPARPRARYGHGGRIGYDQEWRADARAPAAARSSTRACTCSISPTGCWAPCRCTARCCARSSGTPRSTTTPALILGEHDSRTAPWALLHVTWTEWKNLFSLEVYCRTAKLHVEGLARSYGAAEAADLQDEARARAARRRGDRLPRARTAPGWRSGATSARRSPRAPRSSARLEDARFAWETIDAAYAADGYGPVREGVGASAEHRSPSLSRSSTSRTTVPTVYERDRGVLDQPGLDRGARLQRSTRPPTAPRVILRAARARRARQAAALLAALRPARRRRRGLAASTGDAGHRHRSSISRTRPS